MMTNFNGNHGTHNRSFAVQFTNDLQTLVFGASLHTVPLNDHRTTNVRHFTFVTTIVTVSPTRNGCSINNKSPRKLFAKSRKPTPNANALATILMFLNQFPILKQINIPAMPSRIAK